MIDDVISASKQTHKINNADQQCDLLRLAYLVRLQCVCGGVWVRVCVVWVCVVWLVWYSV